MNESPAPRHAALTVGIIGGLGPEATLDFFRRILERTPAERDQDHLHLLIDNDPTVPDRNAAVAGAGPSPAPALAAMAHRLETAGADLLVMPCNAAHAFADAIVAGVAVPFVSIIDVTCEEVMARVPDVRRVGVLASSGALDAGLYQSAFADRGVEVLVPEGSARGAFMALLYRIKAGERSAEVRREMQRLASGLIDQGAEVLVVGCTEVPLVLEDGEVSCPMVSSTDVLVERVLRLAGYEV